MRFSFAKFTFAILAMLFALEGAVANQCQTIFEGNEIRFQTQSVSHRGHTLKISQIVTRTRKLVNASVLSPQVPAEKKLVVGFDNGHVYLWHDGKKADSWGRPPFIVTGKPKVDDRMNGQMFLVLVDNKGELTRRFDDVIEAFATAKDRTCINLMCKFVEDVYPDSGRTRAFNTQSFFHEMIENQAPDTYRVEEVVVTGRASFREAVSAQWTNQMKTMRNAIFGIFSRTYRTPAEPPPIPVEQ